MAKYEDQISDWMADVRRVVARFRAVVLPNGRHELAAEYASVEDLLAAEATLFAFACMIGEDAAARRET